MTTLVNEVLVEHRAAAELTALDVAVLEVATGVLTALRVAVNDRQLDAAAVWLGALLSLLPAAHPLVVAARLGVEVGDLRRVHRGVMVEASHDVAAAVGELRARVEAGGTGNVVQPGVGREGHGLPGWWGAA